MSLSKLPPLARRDDSAKVYQRAVTLALTILMCAYVVALLACVATLSGAFAVATARAETPTVTLLSQSAVYGPATGLVTFAITFNRQPDFLTTDGFGRQADSFQYFIVGDPRLSYPANYDAIIRGEEIHLAPGSLRIRNAQPGTNDPSGGGWGTIRGVVDYTLSATNVLTFSAPLSVVSDHSTDGHFAYALEVYQYGAWTGQRIEAESIVQPSVPTTKADCKNGGWRKYHEMFKNQGKCIAFVEHH